MKLDVGKVVDCMTQGSCIPTDSVKSGNDYSILVHSIETGAYIDSDKINLLAQRPITLVLMMINSCSYVY